MRTSLIGALALCALALVGCGNTDSITLRGGDGTRKSQLYSEDATKEDCEAHSVKCDWTRMVCKKEVNVLTSDRYFCVNASGELADCSAFCGSYLGAGASCQCDDACVVNGDCCGGADSYQTACKPASTPPERSSCAGSCGKYFGGSASCQCDEACVDKGDCCGGSQSYQSACPATKKATTKSSCTGSCGIYDDSSTCQCDDSCVVNGDCCGGTASYNAICKPGAQTKTSCASSCDTYLGATATCQCDAACVDKGDCCGGVASYNILCGGTTTDVSCPSSSQHTSLGDLSGKTCSYDCWGKGKIYNICATGKWQFCMADGTFATCQKMQ